MWCTAILLTLATYVSAVNTNYWPVHQPSKETPWVLGQKNYAVWETGGGTGIESYDIQIRHWNKSVMNGFLQVALRVPMKRLPTGRKNFGGEIEVDLGPDTPTGDGFTLFFMNTLHGQVYQRSDRFSILPAQPDNYTAPDLPTATVTATIDNRPNPTQQWALTLDGIDPDQTASALQIAGNAGANH